jgi:hypothetical protein
VLLRAVLPAASNVPIYQELLMLYGHNPLTIALGRSAPYLIRGVGEEFRGI